MEDKNKINKINSKKDNEILLRPHALLNILEDLEEEKKKLKESEEKYRTLFNSSEDSLFILDMDGKILNTNPSAVKIYGYTLNELIGKNAKELVSPKYFHIFETFKGKLNQGERAHHECVDIKKDGKLMDVDVKANLIDYLGKKAIFTVIRDITEKKKAEQEIINEKNKAQKYLDIAGVMLLVINNNGIVTLINKKGAEILGYKREEIIGKNWFDNFIPKKIRKQMKEVSKKILRGEIKSLEYYENPILTKNKKEKLISWHNVNLKNKKGEIIGHLSSGEDITEKKKAEEELKKSEIYLNMMSDSVIVIDEKSRIISVNNEFTNLWGYSPNEVLGNPVVETCFPKSEFPKYEKEMRTTLKTGKIASFETLALTKDKKKIPVFIKGSTIKDKKGKFIGFIGVFRDISQQKKIERRRKEVLKLKEVGELKSRFLTITSHELKTPLTPAKIQTQMLLQGELGELNEKQKKSFEIVLRNINRLDELISDILEISRLQEKGFKLNFEKTQMTEVIKSILKDRIPVAKDKGLALSYKTEKLPLITADKKRIEEVLINLIDNAIKFTEKGRIDIEAKRQNNNILIKVIDTGIGMTKEDLVGLFKPFFQIEPTYTRRHGGTGLGLSISRAIIEQHGGEISAKSTVGQGSTFYFTLPVKKEITKSKTINKKLDKIK